MSVLDEFSDFLPENRVPTSADFNAYPIRIFYWFSWWILFALFIFHFYTYDHFSACFALSKKLKKKGIQVMKSVSTWSLHEKKRSISFHIHDRCYTFSISLKCLATLPSMFSSRGSCSVCCPETCHSLQTFFKLFMFWKNYQVALNKLLF